MPAMGKFPRPPCFSECYVCGREFSSRSLDIHEPQCLVKWQRNNNRLPVSLRKAAPVSNREKCAPINPPGYCSLHLMDDEYDDEVALLTPVAYPKEGSKVNNNNSRGNKNKRSLNSTPTASPAADDDVPFFEISRPSTATLEHPRILDESYVDKLDMSLTRKDLLDIANLCRISPAKPKSRINKRSSEVGQKSLTKPKKTIARKTPFFERNDWVSKKNHLNSKERGNGCLVDDSIVRETRKINCKKLKTPSVPHSPQSKAKRPQEVGALEQPKPTVDLKSSKKAPVKIKQGKSAVGPKCSPANNKGEAKNAKENSSDIRKNQPPAISMPCSACSRQERPERFHSHPPPPVKFAGDAGNPVNGQKSKHPPVVRILPAKNVVQKPIPLRFKSAGNQMSPVFQNSNKLSPVSRKSGPIKENPASSDEVKRSKSPLQRKQVPAPAKLDVEKKAFVVVEGQSSIKIPGRSFPRAISCYLCGREFGVSSFQMHHPRCVEKWNRNNSLLPPEQRRTLPLLPSESMTAIEWNDNAWRVSHQSILVECEICSRTFLPERLQVHMRSCRTQTGVAKTPSNSSLQQRPLDEDQSPPQQSPRTKRPIVPCYICGREFGSRSIGIHEPQCLAKWNAENDRRPPNQRRPEPKKPGEQPKPEQQEEEQQQQQPQEQPQQVAPPVSPRPTNQRGAQPGQGARPPTVPCYLCGRQFGTKSIGIHEPQCLKKWRVQNESLPPDRRRAEPVKPDILFKENGEVDCEGTFDAIWESHLEQLIPCKMCGRTFFPDRIQIHERSCKGNAKK